MPTFAAVWQANEINSVEWFDGCTLRDLNGMMNSLEEEMVEMKKKIAK